MATPFTFINAKIELSTDGGSTWTDISGSSNKLTPSGGEMRTSGTHPTGVEDPKLTAGGKELINVAITAYYTETANEARELLEDAYQNRKDARVRWSPKGGNTGDKQVVTGAGYCTTPSFIGGEGGSSDALMIDVVIVAETYTESTVA